MSVLAFPARQHVAVQIPSDVPAWVGDSGYTPLDFRVPRPGELIYDSARDKVIESGEYDGVAETRPFVILGYRREGP